MVGNCLLRKLVPDKVYLVRLVVIFLLRALAEARLFRMTAIYAPNAKPNISKKGLIIRRDLPQTGEIAHLHIPAQASCRTTQPHQLGRSYRFY